MREGSSLEDPADQAFHARVPLHVVRAVLGNALPRFVIVTLKPVVPFERRAEVSEGAVGPIRLMDGVSGRVNLVDGDMDVQVVGVVIPMSAVKCSCVTQNCFERL